METLVKEKIKEKAFTQKDSEEILRIYNSYKKEKLIDCDIDALSDFLCIAYHLYISFTCDLNGLTDTQFKKKYTGLGNKIDSLMRTLMDEDMPQVELRMVSMYLETEESTYAGISRYEPVMKFINDELHNLTLSLARIQEILELCNATEGIHRLSKPSHSRAPETQLIVNLDWVLSSFLEKGGYAYSDYEDNYYGWKIDCIKYLLDRVDIKRTNKQIFYILNDLNKKTKSK